MTISSVREAGLPGSGSQAGGRRQQGTSETCEAEMAETAEIAVTQIRHAFSIIIMTPG
jgi:hypothetical protein